ncbi:MAG: PP2C family protein-serine/threonine phosphatase [Elainellaceae cyanobacterium]
MTATPVPRQPTPPDGVPGDRPSPEKTPVFALKDLVSRLYREQNKIQDLLSSLSFALRSLKNLNQFLELTPLIASRVADAEGGALILSRANGPLRLERLHCQDSSQCYNVRQAMEAAIRAIDPPPISPDAGDASQAAADRIAVLDEQMARFLAPDVRLFSTAILVRNVERGRLYVFSRDPEYTWTETRQKLVRLVADQTAVAIENDELTVELRKKERLDRELEIGAEIQLQLLPRQCPQIKGVEVAALCQTANRVGGDYYDFIPANYDRVRWRNATPGGVSRQSDWLESGRWSITIGDVMGKGVPAGLIMTMLRGMLRAEVLNGHSPSRILQHLNHVMYGDLENSNRFVTLFYSEYDPQTRMLCFSNAAHNPPLLWRAASKTIGRLDTPGMLIGLDMDTQYEDGMVELQPGDTVIYYTDGLTDAANQKGDRFDEENLVMTFQQACSYGYGPQEILDYLFETIQNFIGAARHNDDDMTLVVLQVKRE